MFKHLLVPTDGSVLSRRALARAARLAKEQHARLTVLWVGPAWEPNLYAYDMDVPPGFVSPRQHAAHVKRTADHVLGQARKLAAAAGVSCTCHSVQGAFPHVEIIKTAQRGRCDLIVMGSHGRRGISRLLLGSVAAKVLAYAAVPVLICR